MVQERCFKDTPIDFRSLLAIQEAMKCLQTLMIVEVFVVRIAAAIHLQVGL